MTFSKMAAVKRSFSPIEVLEFLAVPQNLTISVVMYVNRPASHTLTA